MASENDVWWAPCGKCLDDRRHRKIFSHEVKDGFDDSIFIQYNIIECNGCGNVSFQKYTLDYQYPMQDDEGNWIGHSESKIFPPFIANHQELPRFAFFPRNIEKIYQETVRCIACGDYILGGLGLRSVIEAVCLDKKIEGRNLETRISKLASSGHISRADANRLHAIRFLGNDAAHDLRSPTDQQIRVALRIVEYLLATLYFLDLDAKEALDTVIDNYPEFQNVLVSNLKEFEVGTEAPISRIVARFERRVREKLADFEAELENKIESGAFSMLEIASYVTDKRVDKEIRIPIFRIVKNIEDVEF